MKDRSRATGQHSGPYTCFPTRNGNSRATSILMCDGISQRRGPNAKSSDNRHFWPQQNVCTHCGSIER
jgi:hypothetical protein